MLPTGRHAILLLVLLLAAPFVLGSCGGEDAVDGPSAAKDAGVGGGGDAKHPIDSFHYNGTTDQDLLMTFSSYGMGVPLWEVRFECDGVVASTQLEAIPIEQRSGRYRFDIDANGLVSYDDQAADENGTISVTGEFSTDARTASGTSHIVTPRCDSGDLRWIGTAAPQPDRSPPRPGAYDELVEG